jgi:hypothetical protein
MITTHFEVTDYSSDYHSELLELSFPPFSCLPLQVKAIDQITLH